MPDPTRPKPPTNAGRDRRHHQITVIVPDESPQLTPAAARALLRIIVKAAEREGLAPANGRPAGETASESGEDMSTTGRAAPGSPPDRPDTDGDPMPSDSENT
jgi:hypothetical protein